MGEAEEEIGEETNGCPRDLLQRLNEQQRRVMETAIHESEEIELNLGLSLGGLFGADPKESKTGKKLSRSTSIAGLSTFLAEDDAPPAQFPLLRTGSLPMESEEEWRKRKEAQFLRRLEAKRKRNEKRNRSGKEKDKAPPPVEANGKDKRVVEDGLGLIPNKRSKSAAAGVPATAVVAPPFGTPNRPRSSLLLSPRGKANAVAGQGFLPPRPQSSSSTTQRSAASRGKSSSGDSKSANPSAQGKNNSSDVRSVTSVPSSAEPKKKKRAVTPESTKPKPGASVKVEVESPPKRPRVTDNVVPKVTKNAAPKVTTNVAPKVTTNVAPRVTENVVPRVTENAAPRVPRVTENVAPRVTDSVAPKVTNNVAPGVSRVTDNVVTNSVVPRATNNVVTNNVVANNVVPKVTDDVVRETGKKLLGDMPFVSTTGDGPNGRRIQGFLYRYKQGEDVRIVCVCHGKFLTPAEFVRHAGGGDVENPLRQIVVAQSSPLS